MEASKLYVCCMLSLWCLLINSSVSAPVFDDNQTDYDSGSMLSRAHAPDNDVIEKRRPMSINQDLRLLAGNLMNNDMYRSQSKLGALGKRSPSLSFNQDLMSLADMVRNDASKNRLSLLGKRGGAAAWNEYISPAEIDELESRDVLSKRTPSFSVNQDLMSIADMMQYSGKGRTAAQGRLNRLGKRNLSVNQDLQSIASYVNEGTERRKQALAKGLLNRLG